MPLTSVRALLIALCPLGAPAVEDTAALFQSHAAISEALRDQAPGVVIERVKPALAPKVGKMELSWGSGCEQSDLLGARMCSMTLGQEVDVVLKVHLPGGLRDGDMISGSAEVVDMKYVDETSIWSDLVPTSGSLSGKCKLCEGVCFGEARVGGWKFRGSLPTFLRAPASCTQPETGSLYSTLINRSFTIPASFLDGEARFGMELVRGAEGGGAQGTWKVKVQAPAVSNPAKRPGLISKVAKLVATAVRDESVRRAKSGEPPLVTQQAASAPAVRKDSAPGHVTMDLTPIETGAAINSRLSVKAAKAGSYCTPKEDAGGVVCRVPMGKPFEYSVLGGIKLDAQPGTVFRLKGLAAAGKDVFHMTFPPVAFEVPVCGAPAVNVTVPILGTSFTWEPPLCGEYLGNVETEAPVEVTLPDIGNEEIPEVPNMPDLPSWLSRLWFMFPITVNAIGGFYGADGALIYGVKASFTIDE